MWEERILGYNGKYSLKEMPREESRSVTEREKRYKELVKYSIFLQTEAKGEGNSIRPLSPAEILQVWATSSFTTFWFTSGLPHTWCLRVYWGVLVCICWVFAMSALIFLLLLSADLFSLLDYIIFINFIVWRKTLRPRESVEEPETYPSHLKYRVVPAPPTHTHISGFLSWIQWSASVCRMEALSLVTKLKFSCEGVCTCQVSYR